MTEKEYYLLSPVQKRLFILNQARENSHAHKSSFFLSIKGNLNIERLETVFQQLIERHELLRTSFVVSNGEPVQRVHKKVQFKININKVTAIEADDIIKNFVQPFDLSIAPIFRVSIVNIGNNQHLMLCDTHHIISDDISIQILISEIVALYEGKKLEKVKVQYKDYAEWERKTRNGEKLKEKEKYWLNKFSDDLPVLNLPYDYPRSLVESFKSKQITFTIQDTDFHIFQKLLKENESTSYIGLLTILNILLSKYCGQEDLVIGSLTAGRFSANLKHTIGRFANTIALRNKPEGEKSFITFLEEVKLETIESYKNQTYLFEELADKIIDGGNLGCNSIFDVMLIHQNMEMEKLSLEGLTFEQYHADKPISAFDLSFYAIERNDRLNLTLEYNTRLFKQETIERMIKHFNRILRIAITHPTIQLKDIDILDKSEKWELLKNFNNTYTDFPKNKPISELFEQQVTSTPHQIALVCENEKISYLELNEKANQLARYLIKNGIQEGQIIGISMDPSLDIIICIIAILKLGAVYVFIDPDYPQERINYIIKNTTPKLLISKRSNLSMIDVGLINTLLIDENTQFELEAKNNLTEINFNKDNHLIYVIYTSGSSGNPKGVMELSSGLINRIQWIWHTYPYNGLEVACQKTSFNFVDHAAEIFAPLLKGVRLVIFKKNERKNVDLFLNSLIKYRITRVVLVPSLLKAILCMPQRQINKLQHLKYVFCSGEELYFYLAKMFYQRLKNVKLINIYGSSEVSADVTFYEVNMWDINDVLRYFKINTISFNTDKDNNKNKYFTTPGIDLNSLSKKFKSSDMVEFPIEPYEYYKMLDEKVFPYIINTASPLYIGHMTSVLPDFVHDLSKTISQLNQNLVKIETSKSMIFLERQVIGILHRQFYGFSSEFYNRNTQSTDSNLGLITSGGTVSNITSLLVARNRQLGLTDSLEDINENIYEVLNAKGYKDFVILGTRLMHYSVRKSTSILGIGEHNIRYVDTDSSGKLCPESLDELIKKCRKNNLLILAIIGIAGTTETGQIDPLDKIAEIASRYNLFFHVDAAWGGATIFSEKFRCKLKGIENADSISLCGHKQLYLPMGISICLFKDEKILNSIQINAQYQGVRGSFDTGQYTIEGSRSAISLTLHAALNLLGKKGYEALINNSINKAYYFSLLIKRLDSFELIIDKPDLNIINYRYIPQEFRNNLKENNLTQVDNAKINHINRELQKKQFINGKTFVSKTKLFDTKYGKDVEILVFRAVLSNPLTTSADLYTILEDHLEIASDLFNENKKLNFNEGFRNIASVIFDPSIDYTEALDLNWEYTPTIKEDKKVFIGKPISNTYIYILDKNQKLVPVGVNGEIYVGGANLAAGYINNRELTDEKFIDNPFRTGEKLYRTGDLGKWHKDGNVEFLGRIDRQVKIRGFRIELGEIENCLLSHPDIKEAAVICKDNATGKIIVGYYVAFRKLNNSSLKKFLSAKLPDYMVPTNFVLLEKIPLTVNGKLDISRLSSYQLEETNKENESDDPFEKKLMRIWSDVLGKNITFSSETNFFEVGGNSLLVGQLISHVNTCFNVSHSFTNFYSNPTLAKMLENIYNVKKALPAIEVYTDVVKIPLTMVQLEMVNDTSYVNTQAYNVTTAYLISGEMNVEHLYNSIVRTICSTRILKASFENENGKFFQIANETTNFDIELLDLNNEDEFDFDNYASPFLKLNSIPLFRAKIIRIKSNKNILLIDAHHTIMDAMSLKLVVDKIFNYYSEVNAESEKPDYFDYAIWQNKLLEKKMLLDQENYWINNLKDFKFNYPEFDRNCTNIDNETNNICLKIPYKNTLDLKNYAKKNNTSLYILLLTSIKISICKETKINDITIESITTNREIPSVKSIIGCIINSLYVRTRINPDMKFQENLKNVSLSYFNARDNSDYPFELLKEELKKSATTHTKFLPIKVNYLVYNKPHIYTTEKNQLIVEEIRKEKRTSRHHLSFLIKENKNSININVYYSNRYFQSTIKRISNRITKILEKISINECTKIDIF